MVAHQPTSLSKWAMPASALQSVQQMHNLKICDSKITYYEYITYTVEQWVRHKILLFFAKFNWKIIKLVATSLNSIINQYNNY